MSDVIKGFRTYLLTKSGVTNLVVARIYPDILPQKPTYPAIVLREISANPHQHLDGSSGMRETRIQVDCWDDDTIGAKAVREQVRLATKPATAATWGTEAVKDIAHDNMDSRAEHRRDGSDLFDRVASIDLIVNHTETAPS